MDEPSLISMFRGVSGADETEARHFLEAFQWDYEAAVKAYFDGGDTNDSIEETLQPSVKVDAVPSSKPNNPAKHIATLDSIRPSDDESDPNDGQAFYVGGSETGGGGQQVLGPPKRNKDPHAPGPAQSSEGFVRSLFEAAKGQGAEVLDTTRYGNGSKKPSSIQVFKGAGCRLGTESDPPNVVESNPVVSGLSDVGTGSDSAEERNVVVKMWRDGFSLDDGPLRAYENPQSITFLDDIKAGRVPLELTRSASGGLINMLLEDHHHENWTAPPPPKMKPFSGAGVMLGSPVPPVKTDGRKQPFEADSSLSAPQVDSSKPTTQIQVRLPDGGRLLVELNHTHTISDIRQAIVSQRPSLAACQFKLLTTFPNREFSDDHQTLENAQLLNSALIVKFT